MILWISLVVVSPFDLDMKWNTSELSCSEDDIFIVVYFDRRIAMMRQSMTGILIRNIIEIPSIVAFILPKKNKND
ncbi:hypothetical protein ACFLQ6_02715 [Thermoproteota archaeon]